MTEDSFEDGLSEEDKQIDDIWADPDFMPLFAAQQHNSENADVSRVEAEEEEAIVEAPDIQDPDLAHSLYHKTLQPLLRKRLEPFHKEARASIRKQVNRILKDGYEKGRDGKQGYYYRAEQAIAIINRWDHQYSGRNPFALFTMLKEKADTLPGAGSGATSTDTE